MSGLIDFGGTENLDAAELEDLKRWYYYYHKLAVCYGWTYKRFRRVEVGLKMISTSLTVVGAALSPVSMPTLALAGVGVCVRTYVDASGLQSRVEKYQLAHSSYLRILDELRGYLRGLPYDPKVLISDMKVVDQMVSDSCPSISEKVSRRYEKTYKVPSSCLEDDLKTPSGRNISINMTEPTATPTRVVTSTKPKDPKRVEAGRRLGQISKQIREQKMRDRIQAENEPSWNYGYLIGITGLVLAGVSIYYARAEHNREAHERRTPPEVSEPKHVVIQPLDNL